MTHFTDLFEEQKKKRLEMAENLAIEQKQIINDAKLTFETPHGQRTLIYLLSRTFQEQSTFTGNSQTYYNIGVEDWGKALLDLIAAADPDTYMNIMVKRIERAQERMARKATVKK